HAYFIASVYILTNEYFFHCLCDSCLPIATYRSVRIRLAYIFNNITTLKSILPGEKNPLSSTRPFK
ncbi:hypothetical protein ABEK46_27680, partial [Klebsiella pneumoniae]